MSVGADVLIVGLDGATLDLIEPWVRDGHLPTLAKLLAEGSSARLNSTIPPMTLPAWSTFLTGANPGRHGRPGGGHRDRGDPQPAVG